MTTVTLPPALLHYLDFGGARSLRAVVSAGDVCPAQLANRLWKRVSRFVNAYGPTECSVCATNYIVRSDVADRVPIGTAIANVEVRVLDDAMNALPPNVAGDLYIGGAGLARGYLGNEQKTREAFVVDPSDGTRIYKTGDRAMLLDDGNLVYMGREDFQVKIRSYRVELAEVEYHVRTCDHVTDCVAVALKDETGNAQLACYYTAAGEISPGRFREQLRDKVPDYMIPNHFIHIDALPINTSGKVDRSLLPAPKGAPRQDGHATFGGPIEEAVAGLWAEMLDLSIDQIAPDANFLELGGESLLAMRLASEVGSRLDVDIAPALVLDYPVLRDFAAEVSRCIPRADTDRGGIPKAPDKPYYPLSSTQRMFWFLYKLSPDSPFNTVSTVVDIEGDVDVAALVRSIRRLTDRHDILRTRIDERGGQPVQWDDRAQEVPVNHFDFSEDPNRESAIDEKVVSLTRATFDLERGPLCVFSIVAGDPRRTQIVVAMHHIVTDAVSMDILVSQLLEIYLAVARGEAPSLPEPTLTYRDYADWEQSQIGSEWYRKMEAYWVNALGRESRALDFQIDHARPALQSHNGHMLSLDVDASLADRLNQLARDSGVTPFTLLFCLFNVFIHRISAERDIVIGTPVGLRDSKELEGIVGPLINTIAVRSVLTEDVPFRDYLAQQKQVLLGALEHKTFPFEKVVEKLSPRRELGRSPIFDVMFDYLSEGRAKAVGGLRASYRVRETGTAKFDLTFSLLEKRDGSLRLDIEYATDLYDAQTIRTFAESFITLIGSAASDPGTRLARLQLASEADRKLLDRFNDTSAPIPGEGYMRRFEEQARKTPEAIAVTCGNQRITYGELNRRANQLSGYLRSLGVGSDVLVGILMERSIDLVVSILGTWKAGGAYVPIEPDFPEDRVGEIVKEANPAVLISHSSHGRLTRGHRARLLNIDEGEEVLRRMRDDNPAAGASLTDLAYVIFTSGSTGKPKGVMIEHLGMVNHLLLMIDYFDLDSRSRVAQNASHCFDISVWQLMCPLLVGARTVIIPKDVTLAPQHFLAVLQSEAVSLLEVVPTFLGVLLEHIEATWEQARDSLNSLEHLIVTGESVSPALLKRWFERCPDVPVVNAYGPAEASDDTHFYRLDAAPDLRHPTPIGRPLQNIRTYVVDEFMGLLPIGMRGEICIAGIAIGRGYLNQPERTREVFLRDGFAGDAQRLYRTGDLVRWTRDGILEFCGRKDHQVKISGHRIELGEVEHHLSKHDAVQDVAVVDWEGDHGKFLAAYYTSDRDIAAGELRGFLANSLPRYMLPTYYLPIAALPLNNSGKVDRSALPKPRQSGRTGTLRADHAVSRAEEVLARVWEEILGVDAVSVSDNFFEIGGDSLASIRVVSRLLEEGYKVSVKDIFLHQTVESLATALRETGVRAMRGSLIGQFPLTPIQADFFRHYSMEQSHYNQAVIIDLNRCDVDAVQSALSALQQRHESLRLRFTARVDGRIVQEYGPVGDNMLEIVDLSAEDSPRDSIRAHVTRLHRSLNLGAGKLVAAGLFRLADSDHLALAIHHLAVDVVSWRYLIRDFCSLYEQASTGRRGALPPAKSSYKDWAEALRAYANGEGVAQYIDYWRGIVRRVAPIIAPERQLDRPYRRAIIAERLDGSDTERLLRSARALRLSLETLLLVVLLRAIKQATDLHECAVDLEWHGRSDVLDGIDVSETVGWFTNVYPVILNLGDTTTDLRSQIGSVQSSLDAVPNHGLEFGLLKYLRDRDDIADLRDCGEPEIIFNYLGELFADQGSGGTPRASFVTDDLVSEEYPSSHTIELDSYLRDGELIMEWRHRSDAESGAIMHRLARQALHELQVAAGELDSLPAHRVSAHQFDLLEIDESRIDRIARKINHKDR